MTNPLNRGSAPGRARDASERPGTFKSGHAKVGGRKKGTPNAISADYARAVFQAAHRVGSDGMGTDGIIGYLKRLLVEFPKVGCLLLTRVLLLQLCGLPPPEQTLTYEEINDFIEKPNETNSAKPGKNPPWPADDLTRIAAKHPAVFGKLLVALLPEASARLRRVRLLASRDRSG